MKNLRNKTNFLLIGILVTTAIFSPFLRTGIQLNANSLDLSQIELKTSDLSFTNSDQGSSENLNPPLLINKQDRLFGWPRLVE